MKNSNDYLNDVEFLRDLDEQQTNKELSVKIIILDMDENEIGEIHGIALSGNVAVNGASSLRRVCSLSLLANEEYNGIASFDDVLKMNKKIKVQSRYINNLPQYQHYPEEIWFPLGLYVITELNISTTLDSSIINLTGHDKMCTLNGTAGGVISSPMVLHEKATRIDETTIQYDPVSMFEIIQELVSQIGGENRGRVIINDLPLKVRKAMKYMGNKSIYFSPNGNELPEGDSSIGVDPLVRELKPGAVAGYDWVLFTYPSGELIAQPGNTVVSILDKIAKTLGNYEFFYDLEGNFVFQEIKNYLNTSFTPITQRDGEDYYVNLGETPYRYDFTADKTIISYTNSPKLDNIKNDFIVWGERETAAGLKLPIRYHLAIDDIPQNTDGLPWQVYLYNQGKALEMAGEIDRGYYYPELQHEIPKLYWLPDDPDNTEGETGWKDIDGTDMDFFLDMIDSNSELGKFSVNTIGRRTIAITDKNVKTIYAPDVPDYVILEKNSPIEIINELNAINQKFIIVENIDLYTYSTIGKSAFDVVRDLVHQHTTYSESISISMLPKYYLEPNCMARFEDYENGIYGNYIITQFQLPLEAGTPSSVTAIKATTRI